MYCALRCVSVEPLEELNALRNELHSLAYRQFNMKAKPNLHKDLIILFSVIFIFKNNLFFSCSPTTFAGLLALTLPLA